MLIFYNQPWSPPRKQTCNRRKVHNTLEKIYCPENGIQIPPLYLLSIFGKLAGTVWNWQEHPVICKNKMGPTKSMWNSGISITCWTNIQHLILIFLKQLLSSWPCLVTSKLQLTQVSISASTLVHPKIYVLMLSGGKIVTLKWVKSWIACLFYTLGNWYCRARIHLEENSNKVLHKK